MILPPLCLITMTLTTLNLSAFLATLLRRPKVRRKLIQDPKRAMSKIPREISTIIDAIFDIDATILFIGLGSAVNDLADRL